MASIKRISDRKYLVRVSKGTGKQRRFINATVRGTLAEARQHGRELESQVDRGHAPQSLTTFAEYSEYWLKTITVSERTHKFYADLIRLRTDLIKTKRLVKITPDDIQHLYNSAPVGPNSVRHLHSTLRALFNHAVRKRHLVENPCTFTDPPKRVRPSIEYLTEHEAFRFIEVCQNAPRGLIFEFALESGMRPEEYLGLRRRDINFTYGTASVDQVVLFNRKFSFGEPKTARSRRQVPLSTELMGKVKTHLNSHKFELVFPTSNGTPIVLRNLRRSLIPILDAADVKRIPLYGLRHTCATLLLLAGVNPKVVADRLGHSSVTMTLDTYSHVLPHIQEQATEKLGAILRNAHNMHTQDENVSDLIQ